MKTYTMKTCSTIIKKTRLVPYAYAIYAMLMALFMVGACDPPSNNDTPQTPTVPANSKAYIYKGMLVGSTGHLTVEITPKDSTDDNKGKGKVTMNMDGKEHVLDKTGDKVTNFKSGAGLMKGHFFNDKGDTVTVSLNKQNEMDSASVHVAGHKGPIAVAMFKETKGGKKVKVYEGVFSVYSGQAEHVDSLVEQSTFNMVVRGETVTIIRKGLNFPKKTCLTQEDIRDRSTEKPKVINGKAKQQADGGYLITLGSSTLPMKKEGKKLQLTRKGHGCVGYPTKKMLNPNKAYQFNDSINGQPVTGYKLKGGGSISCNIDTDDGSQSTCEEVPPGKIPLRLGEDHHLIEIVKGDPLYYIGKRKLKERYTTIILTEVL